MERVNRILSNPVFLDNLRKNEGAEEGRIFCHHNMEHFLDVARIAMLLNFQEGLGIAQDTVYTAGRRQGRSRRPSPSTGIAGRRGGRIWPVYCTGRTRPAGPAFAVRRRGSATGVQSERIWNCAGEGGGMAYEDRQQGI